MATQPQRKRRLELPAPPKGSDPKAIERYLTDIRRLTMDEFNRLSGDFFDFRQDVIASATIPLASVAAISVDPSQYSAVFTWENPVQPQGVPTHVRIRIAEFGDTWQEYTYPITTYTAFGLSPDTTYTFQIQLVRREAGTVSFVSALRNCPSIPIQVESLSEIRSRSFTTDGGIGVPTPDDDGDPIIPIPDTDDPGPIGGTHCWWEWQLQVVNLVTGQWEDTSYSGFVAGDAGQIDLAAIMPLLDPLRVYRTKLREICNGVPGPWEYGPPFTGGDDWADNCGGFTVGSSYLTAPFEDADLWVIPFLCFVAGEGLFVREFLSGVEIIPGMGYYNSWKDAEGDYVMFSREWDSAPNSRLMGSTFLPILETLDNTDDVSIYMEFKMPSFPALFGGVPFGTENVINIGSGRIMFNVTWDISGNWGIQFVAPRESGGVFTLNSPLTLPGGTENWTRVFVTIDQDGDKVLSINNVPVATDDTGVEVRLDGMPGTFQINAIPEMRVRKLYGWSEVVEFLDEGWITLEDLFNRPGPSLGTDWTSTSGGITIVSNQMHGDAGITGQQIFWTTPCASDDFWIQVTVVAEGGAYGHPSIWLTNHPTALTHNIIAGWDNWVTPGGPGNAKWGISQDGLTINSTAATVTPTGRVLRIEREHSAGIVRLYVDGVLRLTGTGITQDCRYIGMRASDNIIWDTVQGGLL